MFGFVLISSKNQVLLLEGDGEFKSNLWQRVEREIRAPLEAASTSSGIVTDLIEPVVSKKSTKREPLLFSLTEVRSILYLSSLDSIMGMVLMKLLSPSRERFQATHLLLPLVSFYRSLGALGDQLQTTGCLEGTISFKELSNGYLIINIGNKSNDVKLLENQNKLLNVCIGPLLDLIDSDFSTLRQGKENVAASLSKHFRGVQQLNFENKLEIRKTAFYKSSVSKIFPQFKSICTQLQLFIGNNRCLLLNKGTIIATANSSGTEKPLTKAIDVQDIDCLVKQIACNQCCKRSEVSQHWLKSKTGIVPFYVNVITYKLSDTLLLVCFSPSKVDRFIRLVTLILMQVDQLVPGSDFERITKDISESVNELSLHLNDFVTQIKESQPDTSFLRNPVKSAQFFKSVWSRLSNELLKNTTPPQPTAVRLLKRFSLSSLKSAISNLSLANSSISLRNNNGKPGLDISCKPDVLLTHWRRQLVTLLQELCAVSRKDAIHYKVPLFMDSMKRILKPINGKVFSSSLIGKEQEEEKLPNFLRPIDHKLDMLAFNICNTDRNLGISYEPEKLASDIENWTAALDSDTFCVDIEGKSGKTYTVYKITIPSTKEERKVSLLRGLVGTQTLTDTSMSKTTITAVFDSFVHRELALKQLNTLSKQVIGQLQDCYQFFQ